MQITPAIIPGCFIIDVSRHSDIRGEAYRQFDRTVFAKHGLQTGWDYVMTATNKRQGTLRGMHCQTLPHGEVKLVRVARGRVFDVAIDLRPASPTFQQWMGVELSAANERSFYIPAGCAHGYLTLEDDSDVVYMIAGDWVPTASLGVRWNDPRFAIDWPGPVTTIIDRDTSFADYGTSAESG